MARSRSYSVQFNNVAITAVQDLIALYCGAMGLELHGMVIGQVSGTTVANLRLSVKRLPATVTAGTGGNAATPRKAMSGDAAAVVTARINDTTQASSSGSAVTLLSDIFNTVNGYQFFWPPDDRPTFSPNEAAVFSLDQAPGSSMQMSGTLLFGELL